MRKPRVCVLRTAGTNCDKETAFSFTKAGAEIELVHINNLIQHVGALDNYHILAFPGGFSYGDDVAAGKILANELRCKLADGLKIFLGKGKLVIGICNGFQVLVKAGFLPGNKELRQEASLIINDSGKFEDRWIYLKSSLVHRPSSIKCVWTRGLPEVIYLPVAHGEGKFIVSDRAVLSRINKNRQVVFRYCDEKGNSCRYPGNPNGSIDDIAGICDETGRILGLMPHPERHISSAQHPRWAKGASQEASGGLAVFKNGVEYARKYL